MKTFIVAILALVAAGCRVQSPVESQPMALTKYRVGQVWNYRTRKGEESSRIFIVRADPHEKLGVIYHIYVDGVRIRNPGTSEGFQDCLPHSPVSEETLNDSVTTLASERAEQLPDVSEGYATWKKAFDSGEGGIFTIPVSQIIQFIEDIVTESGKKG